MSNKKKSKSNTNIKSLYGKECTLPKDEFIKLYNIRINGLNSDEVLEKQNKYGLNQISQAKPKKWYNYFFESLFTPFNSILLRHCCCPFLYRCLPCNHSQLC